MALKTLLLMVALAALATAQQQKKDGPPVLTVHQVKPGLFVIASAGANSEVRVTSDALIVVDGKLPGEQNFDALMKQIKSISDKPVKYLIARSTMRTTRATTSDF